MITRLGHTAYAIADLEASLDFYVAKLGLKEAFRLTHDDGRPWIVYLLVGTGGGFIELFPGGRSAEGSADRPSYRHLCLEVDDMPATLAELAARGMAISGEANRGKDGNLQYWLTDPDGNRIELMQLAPTSPQAQAQSGA